MSRPLGVVFLFLLLLAAGALAAWAQNDRDERALAQLDRDLCAAEARGGDLRVLDRLWADDYVQVSSSGTVDTKKQQLELMRAGKFRLERVDPTEIHAR